ncbi:Dyp-type peroxidase [Kitasatospora sp. NPDC058218]|uniref:Dyp-type peroxidase n=1 Tax=Kitasatospora sp. NPDC058218 TaxID=3346385 RepID=UPI0036DEBECB
MGRHRRPGGRQWALSRAANGLRARSTAPPPRADRRPTRPGSPPTPPGRRPAALAPLPDFPDDRLDPARSGGDVFVRIGADDPLAAVHALRTVRRLAQGDAASRWLMAGFGRARGTAPADTTDRNLMGQLDGSGNPDPSDPAASARIVVTGGVAAGGLAAGDYVGRALLEG